MFRLFISDLVFKHVKKSFNVGKWATGSDLFFDLGEEVTETGTLEACESLVVHLEREHSCNEDNEYSSFHFMIVDFYGFLFLIIISVLKLT
jgi:hypothetical protein